MEFFIKRIGILFLIVAVSATSLSLSGSINAEDVSSDVLPQAEQVKEETPIIEVPSNLAATIGQSLQDIVLPSDWNWINESTLITSDSAEYPACYKVDDVRYDYKGIDGYIAEEHCVERKITVNTSMPSDMDESKEGKEYNVLEQEYNVSVNEEKSEKIEKSATVEISNDNSKAFTDIAVDETNFPDAVFREYLISNFPVHDTNKIYIADVVEIETSSIRYGHVSNFKGLEFFTALEKLTINTNSLNKIDVSHNLALKELEISAHYTVESIEINQLDISQNIALQSLQIRNTNITKLDVTNNLALKYLAFNDTVNKNTKNVDVSNNLALETLELGKVNKANFSHNTLLKRLVFEASYLLTKIDVTNLTNLESLRFTGHGITNIDISKNLNLTDLYFGETGISNIDISKNTKLKSIYGQGSKILKLDTSNQPDLEEIWCDDTPLAKLDLSKNAKLKFIQCRRTNLTKIDISNNPALTDAYFLESKELTEIQVGNHQVLKYFDITDSKIAWISIGEQPNLTFYKSNSNLSLDVSNSTFDITEKYKGIDPHKITILSGAKLDQDTGLISDYKIATPIIYEYDCGTSNKGKETLRVTLNLKKGKPAVAFKNDLSKAYNGKQILLEKDDYKITDDADIDNTVWEMWDGTIWKKLNKAPKDIGKYRVSIEALENDFHYAVTSEAKEFSIYKAESSALINKKLDKEFDGKTVFISQDDIEITGSKGAVTYVWEKKNGSTWETIVDAPREIGTYRVKALVDEDENYNKAESSYLDFMISKAKSTIFINSKLDKEFDGKAVIISNDEIERTGSKGAITYVWEKKNGSTWEVIVDAPSEAGTYRVKAQVDKDENYNKAESSYLDFMISKAKSTIFINSKLDKEFDGKAVVISNDEIECTGSKGAVTYVWERRNGASWEVVAEAPSEAGTYRVKAQVNEEGNYKGAVSSYIEFTIKKKVISYEEEKPISDIKNSSTNDKKQEVKTGDSINMALWIMLIVLSGVVALLRLKKLFSK